MKCTQVNLLPVVNKQNQAEFMQKNKTVSTQCELRTKHSVEHYTTQVSQAASKQASEQAQPFVYLSNALHHKYYPNRMGIAMNVAILLTD